MKISYASWHMPLSSLHMLVGWGALTIFFLGSPPGAEADPWADVVSPPPPYSDPLTHLFLMYSEPFFSSYVGQAGVMEKSFQGSPL